MDGGYYAIKGFEYQIDKTLYEVLTINNDEAIIRLEQIQDINTDDFVMQVKYKEASKFTPSIIREPIVQLIEEYISNSNLNYILYCYFFDENGYDENVDLTFLNKILGREKDKFSDNIKTNFLTKFKLKFSEEFHNQYLSVLQKLNELSFCNTIDEAQYYYSILVDYLRKKVVNNSPTQLNARQVNKKEILLHLNNDED